MSEQFSADYTTNRQPGVPGISQEAGEDLNRAFPAGQRELVQQPGAAIIQALKDGNQRFVEGKSIRKPATREQRSELLGGQHPDVICICCADSRVDPSDAFDMGAGQIFEVENAGEIIAEPTGKPGRFSGLKKLLGLEQTPASSTAIGTVEYMVNLMVQEDRTGVLLVLGHTHCGAVASALSIPEGTSAGSPHLDALLQAVRDHIPAEIQSDPGSALEHAVAANARGVIGDLMAQSSIVRNAVASGHLVLTQAIYHLDSGKVEFLDA